MRTLTLPEEVKRWALTTLREQLVKIGADSSVSETHDVQEGSAYNHANIVDIFNGISRALTFYEPDLRGILKARRSFQFSKLLMFAVKGIRHDSSLRPRSEPY
jgi:hypothetical protein